MNPTQILMNLLQNQLKSKNPQVFQQFQKLQKNQNDPKEVLSGMIKDYTPEQLQQFSQFAKGFGISEEQLKKYGINTK